ncbi:DEAD/DEAH box helicase [Arcobacter sp.]|uniref:DEAD/DEAH box helicase n=1 Tax=Arcobacter sp. TaxID=1872629 RepID=UPI003D146C4B
MSKIDNEFKKELIKYLKDEDANIDILLRYAFFLLINHKDELSFTFSYLIILLYAQKEKDYAPLKEISIIIGNSPILNLLDEFEKDRTEYMNINIVENEISLEIKSNKYLYDLLNNLYINTNKYKDKILTSGQKILYRMINETSDYSVIAPTSYGKTDLMIESAVNAREDVIIIVPLVALLGQVKSDIYNYSRENNLKVKVITHHEVARSENLKNIYVLTQERCYQILKRGLFFSLSDLFIDESHKLLLGDKRSYKLSEVIFLLKKQYKVSIKYYSPVLHDAASIKIKGIHPEQIKVVENIRDIKNYMYYLYDDNNQYIFFPKTHSLTKNYITTDGYSNFFDYIIKNSKNKNIIFLNSPKEIESVALELLKYVMPMDNKEIDVHEIIKFAGKDYYIVDTLKKGVIYIHGQMPEIIRYFLLNYYRNNESVKYLVTNSTILEGVNTPSDNLFIYDYKVGKKMMKPIDFINLRGRINRIGDIVKSKDISKLLCNVHFYADGSRKNKIKKEIINPCYDRRFVQDEIDNMFLEKFNKSEVDDKSQFIDSLKKIKLLDEECDIENIFNEKIDVTFENPFSKRCLMNDIPLNTVQSKDIQKRMEKFKGKQINSIDELLNCIDEIYSLTFSEYYEVARLSNDKAKKFYSMLLSWLIEGKTIQEKASLMTSFFIKYNKVNKGKGYMYVGKSRGNIGAEFINGKMNIPKDGKSTINKDKKGNFKYLSKIWIQIPENKKELYNICIIKIKIEEDFISFHLIPMIEALYEEDKGIISIELYNLVKYKSNDSFEITLMKEGISPYLAKLLNEEVYRQYISIDENFKIDKKILDIFEGEELLELELKMNIYE